MSKARCIGSDARYRRDFLQVSHLLEPTEVSLGHSTVVIIMTIIVAATSAALADKFDSFQTIGGIVGVSVSCSSYPTTRLFLTS